MGGEGGGLFTKERLSQRADIVLGYLGVDLYT
jgi:hypothetical protein